MLNPKSWPPSPTSHPTLNSSLALNLFFSLIDPLLPPPLFPPSQTLFVASLPVLERLIVRFIVSSSPPLWHPQCPCPFSPSLTCPIANLGSVQTFSPSSASTPVLLSAAWESLHPGAAASPGTSESHNNLFISYQSSSKPSPLLPNPHRIPNFLPPADALASYSTEENKALKRVRQNPPSLWMYPNLCPPSFHFLQRM